jgi:hypothetical protein
MVGYLGWTAVRREQCDMWIHCIGGELLEHVSTVTDVLGGVSMLPGNVDRHLLGNRYRSWFPLQQLGKHLFSQQRRGHFRDRGEINCSTQCPLFSTPSRYKTECILEGTVHPCGGGVEYLHRDPASHRRQRKGKSRIWDSKIWSRVPRESDPIKTMLARTSSIYKTQTHPLVRGGVPQKKAVTVKE